MLNLVKKQGENVTGQRTKQQFIQGTHSNPQILSNNPHQSSRITMTTPEPRLIHGQ
jgi:hypothetical protein